MLLRPVPNEPGVWRACHPNEPGLHALVIGISDYPYLANGSALVNQRALNNGGLGQLEVSALSAARFFEQIAKMDMLGGARIASCRLVLAPRGDPADPASEAGQVDTLTQGHFLPATFAQTRQALEDWADELVTAGTQLGTNVACFFFSGHGVEVDASPAILASDVLKRTTADGGRGKALSMDPITNMVKTYNIDRGLLFVDACRDTPMVAKILNMTGENPLNANPNPVKRPDALVRLHSTASGLKSYQLSTDTSSLFTQAVLNGLEGPPPQYLPYDTANIPWALRFSAFESHVKKTVRTLLTGHTTLPLQVVEPFGNPYDGDMLVAFKDGPVGGTPIATPPNLGPVATAAEAIAAQSSDLLASARVVNKSAFDQMRGPHSRPPDLQNYNMMHAVLGKETITYPWLDTLKFENALTGEFISPDVAEIYGGYSEERDGHITAWIDVAIDGGEEGAIWVSAGGRDDEVASAVVIPRERESRTPVRLDVSLERGDRGWQIMRLNARVGDTGPLPEFQASPWSRLWNAQRTEAFSDLGAAAQTIMEGHYERILFDKVNSPTAAAYAGHYLLRAGALDALHHWPRNLADWFPFSDGPILWAETLLRRLPYYEDALARAVSPDVLDRDRGVSFLPIEMDEPLQYFSQIAERGVPVLANSLILANQQAKLWKMILDEGIAFGAPTAPISRSIDFVERAITFAVRGNGYSQFAGASDAFTREAVLGATRDRGGLREAYA